jgi:penicillin-binding protein 2
MLDVVKAIAGSCNIFFYQVGEKMTYEQLCECASDFGFGEKSGLGLAGEHRGLIYKNDQTSGLRRYMGMGQKCDTTPIQVARLMYIVATNGIYPNLTLKAYEDDPIQVKLEKEEKYQNGQLGEKPKTHEEIVAYINKEKSNQITCMQKRLNYPSNVWRYIHQGMREVLTWNHGSASSLGGRLDPTVKIAAKTGTAQIEKYRDAYGNFQKYDKQKEATGEIKQVMIDNAWFAGYAPYENPEYAFAILIELGGTGAIYAGPVIEKILKAIYGTEAKM